jgi:serine protease Do
LIKTSRSLLAAGALGLGMMAAPAHAQQDSTPPADVLTRPFFQPTQEIGVSIRDVTADDHAETRAGAVVSAVRGDGPASKAGIQAGDIVVSYDGERVRSARQLARLIEETPQDRSVPVTVTRAGKSVALSVTPQSRSPWDTALGRAVPAPFNPPNMNLNVRPRGRVVTPGIVLPPMGARLGVQVHELTPQLATYFGTSAGVLVASVDDGTPARRAGLEAGDVITKVDGQAVNDSAALRQSLTRKTGDVTLTVIRDKSERTVTVTLPERRAHTTAPRPLNR